MSNIAEARHNFFEGEETSSEARQDERVLRKILSRWGRNLNNRVDSELYKISSRIVELCKGKDLGIILEDLKGIRSSINSRTRGFNPASRKVQRVPKRSKQLKRRLNSWPFRKLQSFIEYKAKWEGIKVIYANPRNTSRICAICGVRQKTRKQRFWSAVALTGT